MLLKIAANICIGVTSCIK